MNHYILVCSDEEHREGKLISAEYTASKRLEQKAWPLYSNTSHINEINAGDKCLIYLSGQKKNSQSFIAAVTIRDIYEEEFQNSWDSKNLVRDKAIKQLTLKNIFNFEPLSIHDLSSKAAFMNIHASPLTASLRGKCLKISEEDYVLILKERTREN